MLCVLYFSTLSLLSFSPPLFSSSYFLLFVVDGDGDWPLAESPLKELKRPRADSNQKEKKTFFGRQKTHTQANRHARKPKGTGLDRLRRNDCVCSLSDHPPFDIGVFTRVDFHSDIHHTNRINTLNALTQAHTASQRNTPPSPPPSCRG